MYSCCALTTDYKPRLLNLQRRKAQCESGNFSGEVVLRFYQLLQSTRDRGVPLTTSAVQVVVLGPLRKGSVDGSGGRILGTPEMTCNSLWDLFI